LPDGLDAARHTLDHDVVLAPGNVFSASHSATSYLRFNKSRCKGPAVFDALARAMVAARVEERGGMQVDADGRVIAGE
jgi:DNA-binding transcriptional MocR family regulator